MDKNVYYKKIKCAILKIMHAFHYSIDNSCADARLDATIAFLVAHIAASGGLLPSLPQTATSGDVFLAATHQLSRKLTLQNEPTL